MPKDIMRDKSRVRAEKLAYKPPGAPAVPKISKSTDNGDGKKDTPRLSARKPKADKKDKKGVIDKIFVALSPRQVAETADEASAPAEPASSSSLKVERESARRRRPAADPELEKKAPDPSRTPPPSSDVLEARGHTGLSPTERKELEAQRELQRRAAVMMQRMQRGRSSRSEINRMLDRRSVQESLGIEQLERVIEGLEQACDAVTPASSLTQPLTQDAASGSPALGAELSWSEYPAGGSSKQVPSKVEPKELAELRARVPALEHEAATLQAALKLAKEQTAAAEAKVAAAEAKAGAEGKAAAEARAAAADLAAVAKAKLERQASGAGASSGPSTHEVDVLKAENAELRAEVEELSTAAILEDNEKLEQECSSLEMELHGLRRELHAVRSLMSGPQLEHAAALSHLAALKEENALLRAGGASAADGPPQLEKEASRQPTRDPRREKKFFLACGYDVARKQYAAVDVEAVRTMLNARHVNVNCRDNTGCAPLSHAAWAGHEELIGLLVQQGADVDAENLDGATPLHMTVYNDQPRGTAMLVACGAEVAAALEDAGSMGKPEVVAVLKHAAAGKSHPLLQAAKAKAEALQIPAKPAEG